MAGAATLGFEPGRIIAWTCLFLGGIVMILPFVYMLATSLKDNSEVYELSLLPHRPTLDNYAMLFAKTAFPRWFASSLLTATATTLSVLFFDSLVGYTLAIFVFLGNWTAFLWPLIVTSSKSLYTIPVGLAAFSGEFQTEWEMVMTGASVATLPVLLVFILLQKYIINGVMLAGLKG